MQQTREETNGAVKVAFVSPAWPPGSAANGVVTYTALMVAALQALGQRPYVVTKSRNSGGEGDFVVAGLAEAAKRPCRPRLLDRLGYRVAPRRWAQWRRINFLAAQVNRLARERGVELLEIEEAFGLARRLAGHIPIPIVVRLHGPWFLSGRAQGVERGTALQRRVRDEGSAIAAADGVSAPSEDVLRRVRAHYGLALANAQVIANPAAPVPASARWNRACCDGNLILFVGRFDRCKGADTMIEAFRRVAVSCPSARLTLVGPDGKLAKGEGRWSTFNQYISEHIPAPAVRRAVTWLGLQSPQRISALRRKAAVTVVCSRYEAFGYTALEAMTHGCPLIVTAVGGLRELVQDGRNGLLCQPGDPEDLERKILILLRNLELGARLGRQAARDAECRYHPEAVAKQSLDFYRQVIAGATGTTRARHRCRVPR